MFYSKLNYNSAFKNDLKVADNSNEKEAKKLMNLIKEEKEKIFK